jgi:transposase
LEQQPESGPYAMVRQLARVVGVGIETADMLVTAKPSKTIRANKRKAKLKAKHRRQRARATA